MAVRNEDASLTALRRQVRLIVLLWSAEEAGLAPISILQLHTFAYLSNILAPVWDLRALDGKILKRRGGPFYPSLQQDLDRLVGMGMVLISGLTHAKDHDGRWRLEGAYELNAEFASRPLERIQMFDSERRLMAFMQELAFALSALSDLEFDLAMTEDATYSDPVIAVGNVVDFAEWQDRNWSAMAADLFGRLVPGGAVGTPGEKLHLYIRHLHARLNLAG